MHNNCDNRVDTSALVLHVIPDTNIPPNGPGSQRRQKKRKYHCQDDNDNNYGRYDLLCFPVKHGVFLLKRPAIRQLPHNKYNIY